VLHKRLLDLVRDDPLCRRLMTAPGIGPVIALTFVWVTVLSVVVFHEALNLPKISGIALIVIGLAMKGH